MATVGTNYWHDGDSWNPTHGCDEVSPGCEFCYAKKLAESYQRLHRKGYETGFQVTLVPERLGWPLKKNKPLRIFANSMGDFFHPKVPQGYRERIWEVMGKADWHTFLVLTKFQKQLQQFGPPLPWHPNIVMGVSIETPAYYHRAAVLKTIPAKTRWLSLAPCLSTMPDLPLEGVQWVTLDGQTGPKAKIVALQDAWVRDVRDQCVAAGIPFFFGQRGGPKFNSGSRLLDDRTWDEMPC